MNTLALLISYGGSPSGLIVTVLFAGLIIYLLFYVLPLPALIRNLLAVVVAIVLILMLLPGCAITPQQKAAFSDAAQVLGSAVAANVANAAASDLHSGKQNAADYEMAAAFGLFSGVSQIIGNGDASTIVSSFSNGTMPKTAAAVKAIPPTNQNLSAVATIVSTVAGAPPAK